MKKRINLIIDTTCYGCPFLEYDAHYSISRDSGWDCNHPEFKGNNRLVDDHTETKYYKQQRQIEENKKLLIPVEIEHVLPNPFNIPDNCPLETIEL